MRITLLSACVLVATSPLMAQTSGAVFTADQNGKLVDDNVFDDRSPVYLGGGPAGDNGASVGLPDGDYYFQVTDPSGAVLLSRDGPGGIEERRVTVSGGVIASASATHPPSPKRGSCGSALVPLAPFEGSPSNGLQYKVWMTSVADFSPGSGANGFLPSLSKTDNFSVEGEHRTSPETVISGMKFFDHNENGVFDPAADPLEAPIAGWRIELRQNGILREVIFTDENGQYLFFVERSDTPFEIVEVAPGGFIGAGVPGAIWLATTPTSGTVFAAVDHVAGPDFGNLSFGPTPGLGLSKGFFGGPNGEALLSDCEPEWREALNGTIAEPVCLLEASRRAPAPYFTNTVLGPTIPLGTPFQQEYDRLDEFLTGSGALGHKANLLSTQMAATLLNRACGPLGATTVYVDRLQNGILVSLDEMIADAMALLCHPLAPETWAGNPDPEVQALAASIAACLGEFSTLNSLTENKFTPTDGPNPFTSPYVE